MNLIKILTDLDAVIERLKAARELLTTNTKPLGKVKAAVTTQAKKKRKLTPKGRARIAEAVKRRWAKQKKAAAGGK